MAASDTGAGGFRPYLRVYSNESNPFGDLNLSKNFIWWKKIDRDIDKGVGLDEYLAARKKRKRERVAEIERVKTRRKGRESEKARREQERRMLERERERARAAEAADDLVKNENKFCLDQMKTRSKIRLLQGRTKPIDVLTFYLDQLESNEPPYAVFEGLTVKEMEELRGDIKLQLESLDRVAEPREVVEYWEALMVVSESRSLSYQERGLHSSIEQDVGNLFDGKSYKELLAIQARIDAMMLSGEAKVVEFWETILSRLPIYKAMAYLKEIHAQKTPKAASELTIYQTEPTAEVEEAYEINLTSKVCSLKKPKYMVRVRSGYEWRNKYNQTHYDHDNPPPKMVQGYMFDVYYPDLIDKSKVPTYFIEKDGDSCDTCIIRFRAGSPYEDVAFRIVNKEWERSRRKGYRCDFEGGTLHLHFNLQKYQYRR